VWAWIHFCIHGLNPHKTGFGCGFRFSPAGAPKPEKYPKPDPPKGTRTKPETRENPDGNLKNLQKKHIYKIRWAPEPDPKPDGFGCQFSPAGVGSGVKFNPTSFFHGSDFRSTKSEPDPLLSLPTTLHSVSSVTPCYRASWHCSCPS
jgi:hypothetical protein